MGKLKHGMWDTKIYRVWASMLGRCNRPSHTGFKFYGAKGVRVCARWHEFVNFYADMGDAPTGMTLERIDTMGDYCKENCRWASTLEQGANRRNNRLITCQGQTRHLAEWARLTGLTRKLIAERIDDHGWSEERALTTPIMTHSQAGKLAHQ